MQVSSGGPIYWRADASGDFGADQEVEVVIAAVDPVGSEQDLLLKVQSGTAPNYRKGEIEVVYDANNHRVRVETLLPGHIEWTKYANASVTLLDGDRFGARARSNGVIEIFRNGQLISTVTMTPDDQTFFNPRGGHVGLWFDNAWFARFDDFRGGVAR